jgi:hypothetical protein
MEHIWANIQPGTDGFGVLLLVVALLIWWGLWNLKG